MKKVFRIIKNDLACPEAFHPLWFRIEQRYTLFFFFHWWGTPTFAPPHSFEHDYDALKYIKEHYPNAVVLNNYSDNKCKGTERRVAMAKIKVIYNPLSKEEQDKFDKSQQEFYEKYIKPQKGE